VLGQKSQVLMAPGMRSGREAQKRGSPTKGRGFGSLPALEILVITESSGVISSPTASASHDARETSFCEEKAALPSLSCTEPHLHRLLSILDTAH
jgi:hypothetical protein